MGIRRAVLAAAVALAASALVMIGGVAPASPGCPAEPSPSGNVQVNCRAEDGNSPQNTQSETAVAISGNQVVSAYNDTRLVDLNTGAIDAVGYSASTDGGAHFVDMGGLPTSGAGGLAAFPYADPSVASATDGFWATSLAFDQNGIGGDSGLALFHMPVGEKQFQLVSFFADSGPFLGGNMSDKALLAVGADGQGRRHLYVTWTQFKASTSEIPIMLSDSVDGQHWRTTRLSGSNACDQDSSPVASGGTLYVAWLHYDPCTANGTTGTEVAAVVNVSTTRVLARATVALFHGTGDRLITCNSALQGPSPREVIETQSGHDARLDAFPTLTRGPAGILYLAWNDRPGGDGGPSSNATRIYLSYSTNGGYTWSAPTVISGPTSASTMADRFQPAIAADGGGVHAMWYRRVPGPGGVDQIRAVREELSPASGSTAPVPHGEVRLSEVDFPIVQTNPQQDPSGIPDCYMGDYNWIASSGSARIATWGDNRNVVTTSEGRTEHQPDVFFERLS